MSSRLTPNNSAIRGFIRDAMNWILRNLDRFDPFKNSTEYDIQNGQKLGELAILLRAYTSLMRRHNSPEAKRIVALLEATQRNRAFSDRLVRSPHEFILMAEVYASLRAAAVESIEQRRVLKSVIRAGYLNFTERLPHRVMDVRSCLAIASLTSPLPSLSTLYRQSMLWPVPSPIFLDEDGLYFLTHVIMFMFDFGTRQANLPASHRRDLRNALTALIVSMCQEHHWDLLAELLLCWACVGLGPSPVFSRGWMELIAQQRRDGSVPGPEWALRLHQDLSGQQKKRSSESFEFDHHYHTTLVSVIAGSAHLNVRQRQGPLAVTQRRSQRHGSHDAAGTGTALERGSKWLVRFAGEAQPDAGAHVLCAALMGIWIADSASPSNRNRFRRFARSVGNCLTNSEAGGMTAWARAPATLKMIAAALLGHQGFHIGTLHDPDGFVCRVAQALRPASRRGAPPEPELDEKRLLLHRLGLIPTPRCASFNALMREYKTLRLSDGSEEVNRLALLARSHAMHGLRQLPQRAEYRQISETLAALAISRFRRYQLAEGCQLLRSATYLDPGAWALRTCSEYLLLNQRSDGAFGFLGQEECLLASRSGNETPTDSNVALYLPMTVECLWTLAEVALGWRLYRSVPTLG